MCPVNLSLSSPSSSLRAFAPAVLPLRPIPTPGPLAPSSCLISASSWRSSLNHHPGQPHQTPSSSFLHVAPLSVILPFTPDSIGSVLSPLYPSLQSRATHIRGTSITHLHILDTKLALPPHPDPPIQKGPSPSSQNSLPKKYQTPSIGEATSWSMRTFLRTFGRPGKPDAGSRRSSQRYQ